MIVLPKSVTRTYFYQSYFKNCLIAVSSVLSQMYVGNSAVIGRVNLRQLRVSNEKCRLPDKYNIFPICHHGYSYGNRDQKPFGGNQTWYYQDSRASRSTGIHGNHAHYDGGGYRIVLNTNRYGVTMRDFTSPRSSPRSIISVHS